MPQTKEEKAEVIRAWYQSPQGKKCQRISGWKRQGIISDDWDALYERFVNTTHCEQCNVLLTTGRHTTATTRCCDHDHAIKNAPNVRGIICNSCNTLDRCSNTSGYVNVHYLKSGSWCFAIDRKRLKHFKSGFKTKEEAAAYRDVWMGENVESR